MYVNINKFVLKLKSSCRELKAEQYEQCLNNSNKQASTCLILSNVPLLIITNNFSIWLFLLEWIFRPLFRPPSLLCHINSKERRNKWILQPLIWLNMIKSTFLSFSIDLYSWDGYETVENLRNHLKESSYYR